MINPFKTKKGLGRGRSSLIGDSEVRENITTISISSIMSFSAYSITIWAMKYVQIGFVASIRESSIIMATLLGLLILKENVTWVKLVSACIFFTGIYLIYNS